MKVGTIFEDSHIPMRLWLQAIALLCASKKGISSNQLHHYYHASVNHGQEEWVVEEFHTNTVEGFFSIFKRGVKGVPALL